MFFEKYDIINVLNIILYSEKGENMSQLTKYALANSLKELTLHSSLDKITVIKLTTSCGVNRKTFYYHFKDILDLVKWIYKTEALENISDYRDYENWQEGYLKIFHYIEENREFCLSCMKSSAKEYFEKYLYELTYDLLYDVVQEIAIDLDVDEKLKIFISKFYCHGFIGVITTWIKEGFIDKPKELIEQLNALIEGNIKIALEKYI